MKEITIRKAITMPYLMIDMVTPQLRIMKNTTFTEE